MSADCKKLRALLRIFNFTQLISQPTRVTEGSRTLLDIMASTSPQNISSSGVISAGLSDHDMVFCVRKLNCKKGVPQLKYFRNYANYDPIHFCQDLNNVNWSAISPEGRYHHKHNDQCEVTDHESIVNDQWMNFESSFLQVADCHAPVIQKRVRGLNSCPWLAGEIKQSIRHREYLLKKARKSNSDEDWANYRHTRNRVTNCIRKAKGLFNQRLVENNSNDQKAFWKTIHKIFPKDNKTVTKGVSIDKEHCLDDKK